MRPLSPEEQALWERVTATIKPLSRERVSTSLPASDPIPLVAVSTRVARVKGRVPPLRTEPEAPAPRRRTTIHGNLDSHWERRLKNGSVPVDRTLDLHGYSLSQAYEALDAALARAVEAGDRVLLLVTGHHRPGEPPIQRGKIRAAVHDWLAVSHHADRIAAVRNAHRRHGGGGSLYLILRR